MLNFKGICFLFVLGIFSLKSCAQAENENSVLPGIYQLDSLVPLLRNKNIAVVANHSSIVGRTHLVDTLISRNIRLVKVFSPEHGFSGTFDAGEFVVEPVNKDIPVVSLYGKGKKPAKADLQGIDLVIFDLQDVGVRFFTYISTLHYVLQACAEQHIEVIVLDRPNPNAHYIDGPVLELKYKSFIGTHPVPIVYGMTIGEYATMINGEGWLGDNLKCNLSVVKVQNYTHQKPYTLPVKPSPNLPNMLSVYLYPSLCFFEGTTFSVGRGTEFPFQVFGHPAYPDNEFVFTPHSIPGSSTQPLYKDKLCKGVDLRNLETDTVLSWSAINLEYITGAYNKMGKAEEFFNSYFELLAGTNKLRQAIIAGKSPDEIRSSWQPEIESFKKIRAKYLLYP